MNKRRLYNGIVLLLTIALIAILYLNYQGSAIQLTKKDKVLAIGKEHLIAVYEDKLAVDIPFELYASKGKTFGDLVKNKEYEEVLRNVNNILPEKIERHIVVKQGKVDFHTKYNKKIPEIKNGDERYAMTSTVEKMFQDTYYDSAEREKIANQNILVDVLNANGRGGYARKTGERLKKALSVKYNAANYEKYQEESYVILNEISPEQAKAIVMALPEKYFKLKQETAVPTMSNIVVVLGKEKKIDFTVDILGQGQAAENVRKELKNKGYQNLHVKKTEHKDASLIEYNREDYFIAYKISQVLGIDRMVEKDSLHNELKVYVK